MTTNRLHKTGTRMMARDDVLLFELALEVVAPLAVVLETGVAGVVLSS